MATPLTDFFRYIRPHIPMCPEPIMGDALLRAAIEFCVTSEVLSEPVTFATVPGTAGYTVTTAAGTRPSRVRSARLAEILLGKADEATARASGQDTQQTRPRFYYTDGGTALTLVPIPDAIYEVRLDVAVRPTRTATSLDDRLYEQWQDGVVAGALARLYAMPTQPWFSPELSRAESLVFQREVDAARWKTLQGHVGRPVSVAMQPFNGRRM